MAKVFSRLIGSPGKNILTIQKGVNNSIGGRVVLVGGRVVLYGGGFQGIAKKKFAFYVAY